MCLAPEKSNKASSENKILCGIISAKNYIGCTCIPVVGFAGYGSYFASGLCTCLN